MVDGVTNWKFKRGLSDDFMGKLKRLHDSGGWFADVLLDKELTIGIRDKSLGVYYQGQRLFHVAIGDKAELMVETHPKYLVDPTLKKGIRLNQSEFVWGPIDAVSKKYEGRDTLTKMKRAALYYSVPEKTGIYQIIHDNPHVLDVEIAFGKVRSDGESQGQRQRQPNQIDIACLEKVDDKIHLRFWEAKRYSNSEIFASVTEPRVVSQIRSYRKLLIEHRPELINSYKKVASNLVEMARWGGPKPDALVTDVAEKGELCMDEDPFIGLVVFGYDKAQRENARFREMKCKLENAKIYPVIYKGDYKNIKLVRKK